MPSIRQPENIAKLVKTSNAIVTLPASVVNVGALQYKTSALTVNIANSGAGGLDAAVQSNKLYYVYAVVSAGAVALVASTNSSSPTGFAISRLVGLFIVDANNNIAAAYSSASYDDAVAQTATLPNAIINGSFDYWQRATSFSVAYNTVTYCADRWLAFWNQVGGTHTVSRQAFAPGQPDVPGNPSYFMRWACTVAGSGSPDFLQYQQRIEGVRTLADGKATFSFWAKADTARTIRIWWEQRFGTGGSPSATVGSGAEYSIALTTTWTKYTVIFDLPSINGKTLGTGNNDSLVLVIAMPPSTTFTIDIAQTMLNEGPIAAPMRRAGVDLPGELIKCQRYFEKSRNVDETLGGYSGINGNNAGDILQGRIYCHIQFKTNKRAVPTVTIYSLNNVAGRVSNWQAGSDYINASGAPIDPSVYGFGVQNQSGSTVLLPSPQQAVGFSFTADAEL